MTLFVVLICVFVEFSALTVAPFRHFEWISTWRATVMERWRLGRAIGTFAAVCVVIFVPCAGLALLAREVFTTGFAHFIFALVTLLWCCGPRDMDVDFDAYASRYRDPDDRVPSDRENFLHRAIEREGASDTDALRAIAVQAHSAVFAPIFWFVILGPAGALLFRLVTELDRAPLHGDADEQGVVGKLFEVLAWVPVRLFALGLGLAGTLGGVLEVLKTTRIRSPSAADLAADCAYASFGAEDPGPQDHLKRLAAMLNLVKRATLIWLVVLALLQIAGLV